MDDRPSFFRAVLRRWWALISSAVLTIVGFYALVGNKSRAWIIAATLIAAVLLFYLAVYGAWKDERKARLKADSDLNKRTTPSLEVRLVEIYRFPKDRYTEYKFDLFLRARLELKDPLELVPLAYKFELLVNGLAELPEFKHDLDEWELVTRTSKPSGAELLSYPLVKMPATLHRGEPVEGWLHFTTKAVKGEILEKCAIRLVVKSPSGSAHAEHGADPLIWNPRKEVSISRRIDGKLWSEE